MSACGVWDGAPIEDQWPSPPTRKAPIAPTEEQLKQEPWYHGKMSRREAEKRLQRDGDFLVRDSITNPGQYVLTGMHGGQPKHLLLVDPEGVVSIRDLCGEWRTCAFSVGSERNGFNVCRALSGTVRKVSVPGAQGCLVLRYGHTLLLPGRFAHCVPCYVHVTRLMRNASCTL